jgi:PAS domain S-box-containing protein
MQIHIGSILMNFNLVESLFLSLILIAAIIIIFLIKAYYDTHTKRKQVEAALHDAQHYLQRLTETVPTSIYIFDLIDQREVFNTTRGLGLLGYTDEEWKKIPVLTIMHPDDQVRFHEYIKQIERANDNEVLEFQYRMRHKNGDWRWFAGRDSVFMRLPDGRVKQIIGTALDITARKQAEEELRESKARMQLPRG